MVGRSKDAGGTLAKSSRAKQFVLLSIPFGALMATPHMGHWPVPYVIAIWIVLGSLFGGSIILLDSLVTRHSIRRGH